MGTLKMSTGLIILILDEEEVDKWQIRAGMTVNFRCIGIDPIG